MPNPRPANKYRATARAAAATAEPSTSALLWPGTWHAEDRLDRSSAYSYTCGACGRCCRDKLIQVNPYEVALLAEQLGLSTTQCIEQHLEGVYLRRQPDGRCTFFNERGCSVHPARPLVCRLYPLGRSVDAAGVESFRHLLPHPQTDGQYGEQGTVQDWITAQGAEPLVDAVDAYLTLFYRLFQVMEQAQGSERGVQDWPLQPQAMTVPELLDVDGVLSSEGVDGAGMAVGERMAHHMAIVTRRFGL